MSEVTTDTLLQESPACSCQDCQTACQRPCWPTPGEARRLIEVGYAGRLMLDWWSGEEDVYILCGALKGHEGRNAPLFPASPRGCTFFVDGLCQLHAAELKPLEGRVYHHSQTREDGQRVHRAIMEMWNTEEGRDVVEQWRETQRGFAHERN